MIYPWLMTSQIVRPDFIYLLNLMKPLHQTINFTELTGTYLKIIIIIRDTISKIRLTIGDSTGLAS